mgnify:FL=1
MKKIIILSIYIFSSCSNQLVPDVKSKMTTIELISKKGEPQSKTRNRIDNHSQMFNYGETSYQVKEGFVEAKFRSPLDSEVHIQFWRHKFENTSYSITKLETKGHIQHFQLKSKSGIIINYDQTGKVSRIS